MFVFVRIFPSSKGCLTNKMTLHILLAPISVEEILDFANKLGKFTSAPGRPYPDEQVMRSGLLYKRYAEAAGIEGNDFKNMMIAVRCIFFGIGVHSNFFGIA